MADLHLGNVLFKLPDEYCRWSDEKLSAECGEVRLEAVQTFDDKPIPPNVPHHATLPVALPLKTESLSDLGVEEARVLLCDFGEAYRPAKETRLECLAPVPCRPPESKFEPTEPKSFPSDIWTLACTVWNTLSSYSPFDPAIFCDEDASLRLQVEALGKLPEEWWEKWDARREYFTEEGDIRWYPGRRAHVATLQWLFEKRMDDMRRRYELESMGLDERQALLDMLRWMLAYRPSQRASIGDVLSSRWMTQYAIPDYNDMIRLRGKTQ